jgi:flagellar hook assembly protein FlgD
VSWTWDATAAPIRSYTYAISAGDGVRPATGRVPGPPPLAVTALRASPRVLTPNGDPYGERTAVSFGLSRRAAVAVRVENASSGAVVRTLLASGTRSAGTVSLSWDGRSTGGALVADGRYRVEVTAESGAEQVARSTSLLVDRTLGALSVTPLSISPNGDGRSESLRVGFKLTRPASVQVRIRRDGRLVRTVLTGSLASGAYAAIWDGRTGSGARLRDGAVRASVHATTSLGTRSLGQDVRVDTVRPVVRLRSLRNVRGFARLRLTLSEPARLRIWYGRRTWNDRGSVVVFRAAGARTVWRRGWVRYVRVVAFDAAWNRSAAARLRLP